MTLSFSRTDSIFLASGGAAGAFKLWNVKEQACVHSFDPSHTRILSLFFSGGVDIACIAAGYDGSVIRLWRAEGSSDFASQIIGEAEGPGVCIPPALSHCGSFLATCTGSMTDNPSTLALYELETMTKTQSVVIPRLRASCFAVSPDSKQLVIGGRRMGRIWLLQADDFSIQTDLGARGVESVLSAAFDPTCRVLVLGCDDGRLELRTI
jgi:WD40 repeat protein